MPYASLWIEDQGLDLATIAFVVSIGYLFRAILILLLTGALRAISPPLALGWLSCGLLLLAGFMFNPESKLSAAYLAVLTLGLTFALQPIAEAFLVQRVNTGRANYPVTKLSGSLIFALASISIPLFYTRMPIGQIYPIAVGVLAAAVFATTISARSQLKAEKKTSMREAIPLIAALLPVLLPVILIQGSNGYYYAMAFVAWKNEGIDPSLASWLWATAVIGEVVMFRMCVKFFDKASTSATLMICAVLSAARWITFASTSFLPILFVAQIGHAFSFALVHAVLTKEIALRVSNENQVLAHGVSGFSISFFGLFLSMSLIVPAALSVNINPYVAMAGLCLVSIAAIRFRETH